MSIFLWSECNSCWAYATAAVIESMYFLKYGRYAQISEPEMIDCDRFNKGCSSGSTGKAFWRGKLEGFTLLMQYSVKSLGHSRYCPKKLTVYIDDLYTIEPNEYSMAWFIVNIGPLAVSFGMPSYTKYHADGIMLNTYECENMIPNHSAEVIGFGVENGIKYWLLKNSWGKLWGEGGFFRVQRGVDACNIETYPISATVL